MTEPLGKTYLEDMRVHVDEGGQMSHRNGVDLLNEVERLREIVDRPQEYLGRLSAAEADTKRLDFLDHLNVRLNAFSGTTYSWRLIINHNINRLFINDRAMSVDLNDAEAHGVRSCRGAIDMEMRRLEYGSAPNAPAASIRETAAIEANNVIIRVPIDALQTAPNFAWDKHFGAEAQKWKVVDVHLFAKELVSELNRESETGETLITSMLDRAAIEVAEQGGKGIDYADADKYCAAAESQHG